MLSTILFFCTLTMAHHSFAQNELVQPPAKAMSKKTSRITNGIQKKDLAYYKFFSNHYPAVFTVSVNGKRVEEGETITTDADTLDIEYHYEWKTPTGKRINTKRVRYALPAQTTDFTINFSSWNDDERIVIPGAQKITPEVAQ